MIKKGWVEKLDKSAIPNIKNLEPTCSITRTATRIATTAFPGSPV